jgi:3',5'-cyclic AMP phosphodiesterase CpdA
MFCTRAAIDELLAWGAEYLVVKGDVAHDNQVEEYELAASLLDGLPVPVMVLLGNHDGGNHRGHDPAESLGRPGIEVVQGVRVHDVPGLRLVGVDTRTKSQSGSVVANTAGVLDAVGDSGTAALVMLHHQLMTTPFPTYLPPGIRSNEGRTFLDAVAATNPRTMVTTGHTHRHRARRQAGIVVTEVGSTKDHPGTWAGYLVYEGGVVQTVRRIMAPEAIRWTEATGRMCGGAWGRWSPGRLADRCLSHTWSNGDGHRA